MTKVERRKFNEKWRAALADGRVLRFGDDGLRLVSYPTIEARDQALTEAHEAGMTVWIIDQNTR